MADDKKSDDIPMGKEFRAPSPALRPPQRPPQRHSLSITENPTVSIFAYCGSSILMTVTNKYVLSGVDFNLNFFLLAVQVRLQGAGGRWQKLTVAGDCLRHGNLVVQERRSHHLQRFQQ